MANLSFPSAIAAWIFCLLLAGILMPASIIDWRSLKIPKLLTLLLWGAGPLVNIIRGAWLGALGLPVFIISPRGLWIGALDGFLFSLAGFGLGFAIFFLLWIAKTCGGGDVKLFAGIGAWIGPIEAVRVLVASQAVILLILCVQWFRPERHVASSQQKRTTDPDDLAAQKQRRRTSFSLPLTLATSIMLLWDLRADLQLAARRPDPIRAMPSETHRPAPPSTDR